MKSPITQDIGTICCMALLMCLMLLVHVLKYPGSSGFWAGADQHHLLLSARAWAAFDLSPARHHYLRFYAMLTRATEMATSSAPRHVSATS